MLDPDLSFFDEAVEFSLSFFHFLLDANPFSRVLFGEVREVPFFPAVSESSSPKEVINFMPPSGDGDRDLEAED